MREFVTDMFTTLDSYALGEGAPAYFGYPGPDLQHWIDAQFATPEILLMGRVTYELCSPKMPNQAGGHDASMTACPKLVVSSALRAPLTWNNSRLLQGDLAEEVRALKRQGGDRLRTIGSLSVVKTLLRAGLVDRFRLMIFPLILGETGREPLFDGLPDLHLELVSSAVLDGRTLALEYRPGTP